jgi:hypothetical protein
MKFYSARTALQLDRLDCFFESFCYWRDNRTKELIVLWRPRRCLTLGIGLVVYLYVGTVLAATWWLQVLAPGLPVRVADVANPLRWPAIPGIWERFQIGIALPADELMPGNRPLPGHERSAPGANTTTSLAAGPPAELVPGADVFNPLIYQFFLRNGGVSALAEVRSVEIRGIVTMHNGNQLSFTMVKKPPNRVRLNIHDIVSPRESTLVRNGDATWKWSGDPFKNGVRRALPEEVDTLLRETLMFDVPMELLVRGDTLQASLPAGSAAGAPPMLTTPVSADMVAQVYLNADTWRPERLDFVYGGKDKPTRYSIRVRQWMMVMGLPEPKQLDVLVNNQPLLSCQVESIVYNNGVLNVLFEPPAEAPRTTLPAAAAADADEPPT